MYRIYLDVCCLNRPFDNQLQPRIRLESEAVILILSRFYTNQWQWISSSVIQVEINQTPDPERRKRTRLLIANAHEQIALSPESIKRAKILQEMGFKEFDALHIACAEAGNVDVLFTTDGRFQRLAVRMKEQISVEIGNPLEWLKELN